MEPFDQDIWPHCKVATTSIKMGESYHNAAVYFSDQDSSQNHWRVKIENPSCVIQNPDRVQVTIAHFPSSDIWLEELVLAVVGPDRDEKFDLLKGINKPGKKNLSPNEPQWKEICLNHIKSKSALTNVVVTITVTYRVPTDRFNCKLVSDFKNLFLSKENSDVTFRFENNDLPAHKVVLMARVAHFQKLFTSGMKEVATKEILIEDCDIDSFSAFLFYIYCGNLPECDFGTVEKVLILANKYDVPELLALCLDWLKKTLLADSPENLEKDVRSLMELYAKIHLAAIKETCESAMLEKLDGSNVVDLIILSDLFECCLLKTKCLNFLFRKRPSIYDSGEKLLAHPRLMLQIITHVLRTDAH